MRLRSMIHFRLRSFWKLPLIGSFLLLTNLLSAQDGGEKGEADSSELEGNKVQKKEQEADTSDEDVFMVVEKKPSFPGGNKAMMEYIQGELTYPDTAKKEGVEGIVRVKFIVEPDGRVSNVGVTKGIGFGCDKEAVRVIKGMPDWEPGRQRGENVRVRILIPIRYGLD